MRDIIITACLQRGACADACTQVWAHTSAAWGLPVFQKNQRKRSFVLAVALSQQLYPYAISILPALPLSISQTATEGRNKGLTAIFTPA